MESISPIRLNLSQELANPDYFDKFFDERTRDELAAQIREFRQLREKSQAQFAKDCDMKQSAVSRIEQADYSGWTYKTLLRVAKALRARLKISFVLAEDIIAEYKRKEEQQREAELLFEKVKQGVAQAQLLGNLERPPEHPEQPEHALPRSGIAPTATTQSAPSLMS